MKKIGIITLLFCQFAFCQLWVPAIFSDGFVMQRNKTNLIWGTSEANAEVEIAGNWMNMPSKTKADASGYWQAIFQPPQAGTNYLIKIVAGDDSLAIQDVLCGEVWICSGQSNMDRGSNTYPDQYNEAKRIDLPNVRLFNVAHKLSRVPLQDVDGEWFAAMSTDSRTELFSAPGYFFGKKLSQSLNVPIGLIETAWGGARIEPWTPICGFEGIQILTNIKNQIISGTPGTEEYARIMTDFLKKHKSWYDEATKSLASNSQIPEMPQMPPLPSLSHNGMVGTYNAMVKPIAGFAAKGIIWYQGESNHSEGILYAWKQKALVEGWRKEWHDNTMPFYFVQIAPYMYGNEDVKILPEFQEAQAYSQEIIVNTAMVIINDYTTIRDIHPPQKEPVGYRLANLALNRDYGFEDVKPYSPSYKFMTVENGGIRLHFDNTYGSMESRDGKKLTHFEIAGNDGMYVEATAIIDGETVLVSSDMVEKPVSVRFAWNKLAEPNLTNAAGLPAGAFRTNRNDFFPPDGENLALGKSYKCSDENSWGWNDGLCDGSWTEEKGNCFASGRDAKFPKTVTLDLEKLSQIEQIRLGTPAFGSTRDIEIQISKNGRKFEKIASLSLPFKKSGREIVAACGSEARYVRLSFIENFRENAGYDANFCFITELEVYGKAK